MNTENPKIARLIAKIDKLPTLPIAATKIIQIVNNPNATARDVNQVIATDQALAAKVLKLVNSAYYGLANRVSSITQAVVILGFNTIKSLALSASVLDTFSTAELSSFKREEFWKHSLGVAVTAKLLAQATKVPEKLQEEYFIGGLLHDMGKIVFDQYLHDEFSEVATLAKDASCPFIQAEREVMGTGHPEVGRLLAERWNLPMNLREAIGCHHEPKNAQEHKQQAAVTHLANILCKSKQIGFSGDYDISGLDEETVAGLNIPAEQLEKLLTAEIDKEFGNAAVFLHVATGQ